jgi:hypothetical protein
MDGARWDSKSNVIEDSLLGELFAPMPLIHFIPSKLTGRCVLPLRVIGSSCPSSLSLFARFVLQRARADGVWAEGVRVPRVQDVGARGCAQHHRSLDKLRARCHAALGSVSFPSLLSSLD